MKSPLPRRPRRPIDTLDYMAFLERVLRGAAPRLGDEDPEDLRRLFALERVLDETILDAVRRMRAAGVTWEDIGAANGTTRQAAIMRWNRRL